MVDSTSTEKKVYNFSPGPGILPEAVMRRAQAEMLNWRGTGISVMEMSHRSKEFIEIAEKAKADLKKLLDIPNNFTIFFFQGGATHQFSSICYNLLNDDENQVANYLTTGYWTNMAINEAKKYCNPNEVANNRGELTIPDSAHWNISPEAKFFHYCDNETITGIEFKDFPFDKVPEGQTLVCDMSSNICSRPIDWSKYGVVYAGASKNVGPAGACVTIIRNDLIAGHMKQTPILSDWELYSKAQTTFQNTPTCYTIYMMGLNIEYMLECGGIEAMSALADERSQLLYNYIDDSEGYYVNKVDPRYRSRMNIPFNIKNRQLEAKFVQEAYAANLIELQGHVEVGGLRASIYNAMPVEGVRLLIEFMDKFKAENPISATE